MSDLYFLTDIDRQRILLVASSRMELNRKLLELMDSNHPPLTATRIHSSSAEDLQFFIREMKNKNLPFNRVAQPTPGYVHVVKRE